MKTVVPVEGFFLADVPAVEQEVSDERARELVASGAFVEKPPPRAAKSSSTETRQDGGSPDSEES